MTDVPRHAHWWNSNTNIIGITISDWISDLLHKMNPHLCHQYKPEDKQDIGPTGETTTIMMLIGHTVKPNPYDLGLIRLMNQCTTQPPSICNRQ